MQDIVDIIHNDSTIMLIIAVGIATLLMIFLAIVISEMRLKMYKNRYKRIKNINKEMIEQQNILEEDLQRYKLADEAYRKKIQVTKIKIAQLEEDTFGYEALLKKRDNSEQIIGQLQDKLHYFEEKYRLLSLEKEDLKQKHDTLIDENMKTRTSNARLLMKLESMQR